MVSIEEVRSANITHFRDRPLVAVFVGATSGIGEYAVRALASIYSNQAPLLRLYIVGRNKAAAQKIISECSKKCSGASFTFVQAGDLALIKDIDEVSNQVLQLEGDNHQDAKPRIDHLMMTQGQVIFGPRQETSEGLDRTMSLIYYSRIRLITDLLPLLLASDSAHIVSVYAAGLEGKLFQDDLSLRNPTHYSFANARSNITYMTTMAFEHIAKEYKKLSLAHVFPGVVVTPSYTDSRHPLWFKVIWSLVGPIVRRFQAIPQGDAGMRMLFLNTPRFSSEQGRESEGSPGFLVKGTDGVEASGAYAVGESSETVKAKADYGTLRKNGFEETVWEHTIKAFSDIGSGRAFSE